MGTWLLSLAIECPSHPVTPGEPDFLVAAEEKESVPRCASWPLLLHMAMHANSHVWTRVKKSNLEIEYIQRHWVRIASRITRKILDVNGLFWDAKCILTVLFHMLPITRGACNVAAIDTSLVRAIW